MASQRRIFLLWHVPLALLLSFPLVSAGGGIASQGKLSTKSTALSVGTMFKDLMRQRGPLPTYSVTQPSVSSTLTQIRWPMCFGKHSAMMGSFCVPQQEAGSEDAKGQGLMMELQSAPGTPVTLFLFGDEDDAYGRFWTDAIANKSCDAMSKYALATLWPDASGRVQGGRQLTGKEAHLWYAVAVDCDNRQCPNVSSVNMKLNLKFLREMGKWSRTCPLPPGAPRDVSSGHLNHIYIYI